MKKILVIAALFLGLVSCEETMKIEKADVNPVAEISFDGESVFDGSIAVEFEKSVKLSFTASGVSYIELCTPEGWSSSTSMDTNTITLTAPKYSNKSAAQSGTVLVKIFDGAGGHIERSFEVSAFECDLDFGVVTPDILSLVKFSLGSKTWFVCDMTGNVGSFNFELPNGWTAEKTEDGFVITAPVWTPGSGLDQDGTVSVTPVSYSGTPYSDKKVSFSVHVDEKATFQFTTPGSYTFEFGATQTIDMVVAGIKTVDAVQAPQGWTVDYSKLIDEGKVTVTAPAESSSFIGIGALSFTATQQGLETSITSEGDVTIRLRGVNSREDLLAFREVHGATGDVIPDYTLLAPWLVNGELKLNADISLGEEDMYQAIKAYFIHHLYVPINGNGHTLTANFKGNKSCLGLFQHVHKDIHDLNIAGSFELEASASAGVVAAIAQQNNNADVTITRVNSSATIIFSGLGAASGSRAGGLFASAQSNKTLKLVDCTVSGDIILNQCPNQAGGIIATGTNDGKGGTGCVSIEGCTFSGRMAYNEVETSTAHYTNARIGGIIGSQERYGVIKNCNFTGSIDMYLGGSALFTNTGGGVGGIMGRCNAETSGYTMATTMTGCKSQGAINIYSPAASERLANFGQTIGVNLGTCTPENCTENTTISTK